MKITVTHTKTKDGVVYRQGDVIVNPTSRQISLARIFRWTIDREQEAAPGRLRPDDEGYGSMTKAQLSAVADELGHDTDGLTKAQLRALLEG